MNKHIFPCMFLLSLMLSACSVSTSHRAENTWSIQMTQSGGIMGLVRSVDITADGKFSLEDKHTGKTTTGTLTSEELMLLSALINEVENTTIKNTPVDQCPDCFFYRIAIQKRGVRYTAEVSDGSLSESDLDELINFLRTWMDQRLDP